MSTDFNPQDRSGNFTGRGNTWRGRLTILLILQAVIAVLAVTAISFEVLAEELAKVYVVPMLVGIMFTSLALCTIKIKYRSDAD